MWITATRLVRRIGKDNKLAFEEEGKVHLNLSKACAIFIHSGYEDVTCVDFPAGATDGSAECMSMDVLTYHVAESPETLLAQLG